MHSIVHVISQLGHRAKYDSEITTKPHYVMGPKENRESNRVGRPIGYTIDLYSTGEWLESLPGTQAILTEVTGDFLQSLQESSRTGSHQTATASFEILCNIQSYIEI
jgi:hypothetical protein